MNSAAPLKILIAPDSFKGSLTSVQVADIVTDAARNRFPDAVIRSIPVADGGEGTVDAILHAAGGSRRETVVPDPLGRPVRVAYGMILRKETIKPAAVLEMAQASGLTRLAREEYDPLRTSSFGTGELIKHVLDEGETSDLVLGIGGSATNDGGAGVADALGARFLDEAGQAFLPTGGTLGDINALDLSGLDPRLARVRLTVLCDVRNPMTGPEGASAVYGPQKGADPATVAVLEAGMRHYRALLLKTCGRDVGAVPGTGAAGGLAASLLAFLPPGGCVLRPGIDTLLDLAGFDALLQDTDLVITGEGRIDRQTPHGKVIAGIGFRCQPRNIPVLALCGGLSADGGTESLYANGISGIMPAVARPMTLAEAMENAEALLADAADRLFRLVAAGRQLPLGGRSR